MRGMLDSRLSTFLGQGKEGGGGGGAIGQDCMPQGHCIVWGRGGDGVDNKPGREGRGGR